MALLRLESGEIYTSFNKINALISPHEVGQFFLNDADRIKLATPITHEQASTLSTLIPESLNNYCIARGLAYTGGACLSQQAPEALKQRIEESALPHLDLGDEVHICFGGSLIVYFQKQEQYALIIQASDWVFIKKDYPVWVKPTSDYLFTFASYHADKSDTTTKKYTSCEDKNIL